MPAWLLHRIPDNLSYVEAGQLITHALHLAEWKQGFALSRSGEAIKVVLEP